MAMMRYVRYDDPYNYVVYYTYAEASLEGWIKKTQKVFTGRCCIEIYILQCFTGFLRVSLKPHVDYKMLRKKEGISELKKIIDLCQADYQWRYVRLEWLLGVSQEVRSTMMDWYKCAAAVSNVEGWYGRSSCQKWRSMNFTCRGARHRVIVVCTSSWQSCIFA